MDDICLTHDNRNVQERVSREALATQSIVLAGWLRFQAGWLVGQADWLDA